MQDTVLHGSLLGDLLVFGAEIVIELEQYERIFGNCLMIARKERKLCVGERKTLGFLVCLILSIRGGHGYIGALLQGLETADGGCLCGTDGGGVQLPAGG